MADLYVTLKTLAAHAASTLVLPLGWVGDPFTPPHGSHLRGRIAMTGSRAASLGVSGLTRVDGRIELTVVTASGDDVLAASLGSQIARMFIRGTVFDFDDGTGTILTPALTSPAPDGARTSLSVTIPFYAYKQ